MDQRALAAEARVNTLERRLMQTEQQLEVQRASQSQVLQGLRCRAPRGVV